MANAVFPKYKESVIKEADANNGLDGTTTAAPYVALVDTGTYTYNATHQFYSSLTGIVGTDMPITTPTVTNGTFDGDDVTFTAVSGASVEALVIYRHNAGANTTWRLVLYEDTSVTGLPVTPNGGNIVITWNASGIFTISDKRLKTDIEHIGEHGDLGVYEYSYIGSEQRFVGFMAQEVEKKLPHAVVQFDRAGHLAVNYAEVLRAA
jgi:hypothetical protein